MGLERRRPVLTYISESSAGPGRRLGSGCLTLVKVMRLGYGGMTEVVGNGQSRTCKGRGGRTAEKLAVERKNPNSIEADTELVTLPPPPVCPPVCRSWRLQCHTPGSLAPGVQMCAFLPGDALREMGKEPRNRAGHSRWVLRCSVLLGPVPGIVGAEQQRTGSGGFPNSPTAWLGVSPGLWLFLAVLVS